MGQLPTLWSIDRDINVKKGDKFVLINNDDQRIEIGILVNCTAHSSGSKQALRLQGLFGLVQL